MEEREIEALLAALPQKARFCVAEVVTPLAQVLDISENAARIRIYRAICDGRLQARQHLGSLRIPRAEVLRILHGETPHAT